MNVDLSDGRQRQMAVDCRGGANRRPTFTKVVAHWRVTITMIAGAGAICALILGWSLEWIEESVILAASVLTAAVVIWSTYPRRTSLRRWAPGLTLGLVSVMLLAYPTAGSAAVTTPGPTGNQQQTWAPAGTGGWTRDFLENFDAPLNTNVWGRYNGRSAASTMSTWVPSNVYTCHVSRAAAHQYDQYQWRVDLGWCFQRARGRADSGSMARQGKNRPRPGNRLCILAPCSTRPVLVGRRRSI